MLNLKHRVKTAQRGHKLLRDKQDGLMQKFMEIIREARSMRRSVEEKLDAVFKNFLLASALLWPEYIENALLFPTVKTELEVNVKNVMSVRIPEFTLTMSGEILNYGFAQTSGELDLALRSLQEVLPLLIQLAQIEKQAENLAVEIEKTRRRVNALEYKMIPDLQETLKFIKMKLEEADRQARVSVMKVKEIVSKEG